MDPDRHLQLLRADIATMTAMDPDRLGSTTVAACPGWTAADLVSHTAGVFRFATAQLGAGAGSGMVGFDPPHEATPLERLRGGADALLAALDATDPDEHRPNWAGAPTAAFWFRRMAHEAAIHRVDLQLALDGRADPIDVALAADGIDELADTFLHDAARRGITGTGETVHLHATDGDPGDDRAIEGNAAGEWMFTFTDEAVTVTHEHGKGDMAVRGSASDLLLFAWNRRPVTVECFGAPDPLEWWPAHVRI